MRVSGTVPPYCRRGTLRGYLNVHTGANAFFTMFEFPPEFYPKADDRGRPFGDRMMPYDTVNLLHHFRFKNFRGNSD